MFKGVLSKIAYFYDKKYKQLLILPILLLFFSIFIIGSHFLQTGELVAKGVSLKGGITVSIAQSFDAKEMSSFLAAKFPHADVAVRSLSKAGANVGIVVEASDASSEELVQAIEGKLGALKKDQYTVDSTGPSLGAAFFKQAIISVIIAFVLISGVVYLYFRAALPSFYAVFSVFADMLFALAMFNLFDLRLTTAGVAAFLMLIGYSIDTDILLTTRVLKRKEGSVAERMASAVPTGMTMTVAALAAVLVAFYATDSELLKQIMFILGWGLVADIIYTWFFNAPLLRMYVEKQEPKGEQHGA